MRWKTRGIRACLQGEKVTLASGLPYQSHIFSFFLRRVYKTARVTRLGGLPYLRARVTLADGLTFSLVNTPGRVNPPTQVNFLIVSRPFECNRALRCPGLWGYPTCEILLVNPGFLLPSS